MKYQKILKGLSFYLQRSPKLWKFAVTIFEIKVFNPSRVKYKKSTSYESVYQISDTKYNIIFDAQCLQTQTRQRGIGTFSLKFIKAVCAEKPNSTFAAVLTTICSFEDLAIAKAALENLKCSNLDILILDPFNGSRKVSFHHARNSIRETLESMECHSLISLSPFEKHRSTISIPKSKSYTRIAILYDLIRLVYPKQFLFSRSQRSSFEWSLGELKQYDLLLSISNETKKHWSKLIGDEPPIYIVHGGSDAKKYISQINFHERRGVLCIGAEQPHKNLERLISAYSQIPISLQLDHPLTILGIRSKGTKARLAKLARKAYGEVNFPDYLDSHELNNRYEKARILVMPSLIEGLSLPIFEAWSHGLVVIASGGTVADELINDSKLTFDPYSPPEIAKKIEEFLTSESGWNEAREKSIIRAKIYTWPKTANLALQAVKDFVNDEN